MVQTGFWIGDRAWWVMASIDISGEKELNEVYESLLSVGCSDYKARKVCMTISNPNKGYTLSDYDGRYSLMFVGKATDPSELYDTIEHEKRHVEEHIGNYYGVDPKSEEAAYLAGEIGRLIFPAVAYVMCPKCHCHENEFTSLM